MPVRRTLIAVTLAAMVGASCGGGEDDAGSAGGGGGGGGETVTLTAADFAFEPSELSARVGGSIELTNEDDTAHNFTAEESGLDEDVDAGGSGEIDLAQAEPGTHDLLCRFHPVTMTGRLEITAYTCGRQRPEVLPKTP